MYISDQWLVVSEQKSFCCPLTTHHLPLFSHTFLPRTIRRRADRARDDRTRRFLRCAGRGPIRRGTRLRVPTSRRKSARGRPSRGHPLARLFFDKPNTRVGRFLTSRC